MFQAQKTRQRREPGPVGVGKPLTPSAAIRIWYKRELMSIVKPMIEDYRKEMTAALTHPEVQLFYAQDAAASSIFEQYMKKLKRKWSDIFKGFAAQLSTQFVDKSDAHTKSSTWFSLTTAGIEQPRQIYNENIANTLQAAVNFNHTLITGIHEDAHERLYKAIMLSVTSPDQEQQGSSGIENALLQEPSIEESRIDLITRDQTAKLNSSLCTERMSQAGVQYFQWSHSSAGKVPRESHQDMDGGVFQVTGDDRLWHEGTIFFEKDGKLKGSAFLKKGDLGPPGWAINCRCRMVPLVGYNDDSD